MRTIQELAKEAIDVQDASNLKGVLNGMSDAIAALEDIQIATTGRVDRESINKHPIIRLWAWKVVALTGTECMCLRAAEKFSEACKWCSDHVEGAS
jgi:hypothetical protein